MPRRKTAETKLPDEPVVLDAETARRILETLDGIGERLDHIDGQLAALTDAVDEMRVDYEWAMRNRKPLTDP